MEATSFHNTNNEQGETLYKSIEKARTQEDEILGYFEYHKGKSFSPEQIWKTILPNCPLTSVRRAMSNLTHAKKLEKTNETTIGMYKKKISLWKLKA